MKGNDFENSCRRINPALIFATIFEFLLILGVLYAWSQKVWIGVVATGVWLSVAGLVYCLFRFPIVAAIPNRRDVKVSSEDLKDEAQSENNHLIGKTGVARSALRPAGTVEIAGERLPATAIDSYIKTGTKVIVVTETPNGTLVVENA